MTKKYPFFSLQKKKRDGSPYLVGIAKSALQNLQSAFLSLIL